MDLVYLGRLIVDAGCIFDEARHDNVKAMIDYTKTYGTMDNDPKEINRPGQVPQSESPVPRKKSG